MYALECRPSIPPKDLPKAHVLMALDSMRSEKLFYKKKG
jgi:hypothetical protein